MSKNNPASRGKAKEKFFGGKKVKPVLYVGTHHKDGHGKFMAVQYEDGKMAEDNNGKPIMWDTI